VCTSNTDCDVPGAEGDVCVNGKCRCSSLASCIKQFDGTTETCE
jgi:hypothetical protein